MKIRAAGDNMLLGTPQRILLVVARGADSQIAHRASAWFKEKIIFQFSRSSKKR